MGSSDGIAALLAVGLCDERFVTVKEGCTGGADVGGGGIPGGVPGSQRLVSMGARCMNFFGEVPKARSSKHWRCFVCRRLFKVGAESAFDSEEGAGGALDLARVSTGA